VFRCNAGAVRMFQLDDRQEFIDNFYSFSPEYQPDGRLSREAAPMYINEAFEKGECSFEWMHLGKDGVPLPTETTLIRIVYDGEFVVAGFLRDLREHKQMMKSISDASEQLEAALEEATKANEAKSSFLANMSHEMRTPLNAIIGLTDLTLGSESLDDESYRNLGKINNAGMALLSMVNDLLDISKIEAGKFELVPIVYGVPSLINDTANQCILYKGKKPIQLILDLDESLPSQLYGDELRVKQILNNLLSNAFKYTNEGIVTLGIRCVYEGGKAMMTASVRDTGIGVRPESLKNIFDNYAQMDMQANRKIMGTGLGLPITKRLVELMGGTIRIESEYGAGSVFTVEFPQEIVSQSVIGPATADNLRNFQYYEQKREQDLGLARVSLPDARVLVVDDVATNLDVAKGMMAPYDMTIDCATNGQDAIDAIADGKVRYNAVFMDHMMPGMDGIEAVARIRQIGTDYAKNIPIIALTANVVAGNEEMFLEKGFQAFISKPIEMSRLDAVIHQWIRGEGDGGLPAGGGGHTGLPQATQATQATQDTQAGTDMERRVVTDRRSGIDRRQMKMPFAGLDMEKGIERFGGNRATWFAVLRSYMTHTRPLLEKIRDVSESQLDDYAITIHGIKGSSRGINASMIGNAAEKLENAAKAGDFAYIKKHNNKFLGAAWKLIHDLEDLLADADEKDPRAEKEKPDRETLLKLMDACGSYNMDGVDDAMAQIGKYHYTADGDLASWLADNVEQMNFKEIVERLSGLV
ncbi:MAG: ATP-binding protein, partial [Clostridiales bacterium]|nr:ATP-binding protein [Clostridiales bacterium]